MSRPYPVWPDARPAIRQVRLPAVMPARVTGTIIGENSSESAIQRSGIGASGAVGEAMIEILEERAFPIATLYPLASSRSAGDTVRFAGKNVEILDVEEFDWSQVQIALFSAGAEVSAKWAPIAAEHGCIVIDNTPASVTTKTFRWSFRK